MWRVIEATLYIILLLVYWREAYLERKEWREFMKGMDPVKDKGEPKQGGNHGKG